MSKMQDEKISLSRNTILSTVRYQVINTSYVKEYLDAPYKLMLDFVVIYRCVLKQTSAGICSLVLRNEQLCKFNISFDALDESAQRNTLQAGFIIKPVEQMLADLNTFEASTNSSASPLYVITNPDEFRGAAVLLFTKPFRDLAHELHDNLYILPSSIHEVLALPSRHFSPRLLEKMVKQVNATEVRPQDRLSEHVYSYDRYQDTITIVDTTQAPKTCFFS